MKFLQDFRPDLIQFPKHCKSWNSKFNCSRFSKVSQNLLGEKKQKMPFYFLLIFNFLWINKVSLFPYFSQKIQSSWKHSKVLSSPCLGRIIHLPNLIFPCNWIIYKMNMVITWFWIQQTFSIFPIAWDGEFKMIPLKDFD